ncbi:MAG: hypothetical protein FWD68_12045 [Alphaproteobacteria bacterium]|nr:hypothetical protein [Alphaproteobacteria bacterium]
MQNIPGGAAYDAAQRSRLLSGTALLGIALSTLVHPTPASADPQFLTRGSLLVSSTTYDKTKGTVATLKAGVTKLPNSATATTTAVAGNSYLDVWSNESVDAAFGVTSAIELTDINLSNYKVFRSMQVPADQVVTSFPSKSELGLHVLNNWPNVTVTFVAYGRAAQASGHAVPPTVGVGNIDVSNSDAVQGQDTTNPVTFAFGSDFAFRRTIVSVNEKGAITYTPTDYYGGNNGRASLLGSNGLYYMVGNANNGDASTFAPNGTNPDVTQTTGLAVVKPINASVPGTTTPSAPSASVDPQLQFALNKNGGLDKAGKDNNYRGVTEFGGALYFTKGSGSNGMNTVYTVQAPNALPTIDNATASKIAVVPGFPTDAARTNGGDYTPFAVFFADAKTMYVTDEGTGGPADTGVAGDPTQPGHAGLQKWVLGADSQWHLQYILTRGLIGAVDSSLSGYDGPWPTITTVGLRNLTGRINKDGTVTLWATTSTKSASGDNGADPNKVVEITDQIAATQAGYQSFTTVLGPVYGTVFRGVGFVE